MPKVSVIMPVYNAGQYLAEAIESILKQSFKDFEFIIIDDASNDKCTEIIDKYNDPRIVFVRNPENIGVARTLNRGLKLARGKYVARMDADDISMPERFDRQVRFMDEHPEIGISGAWVQLFGIGPSTIARKPTDPREISIYMLFENPLWHMTVIMRREFLLNHNLYYDPIFSRSEDFDLWARAIQHFPIANLGEVLVRVREHRGSATRANWDEVARQTEIILGKLLEHSGFSITSEDITFHHRVGRGYRMDSKQGIEKAEAWLNKICEINSVEKKFADDPLRRTVATVWFRVCANSGPLGPWIYRKWASSSLCAGFKQPLMSVARFVASIIWHRFRRIFT